MNLLRTRQPPLLLAVASRVTSTHPPCAGGVLLVDRPGSPGAGTPARRDPCWPMCS